MPPPILEIHDAAGFAGDAYYLAASHQDLVDLGPRNARLPPIAAGQRQYFIADYQAAADSQIAANHDNPDVWYTALATKNVWHSGLYLGLEHLWRLDRLLHERKDGFAIVARSAALRRMAAALATARGWQVRMGATSSPVLGWLKDRLRGPVSAFRYLATLCDQGRGPRDLAGIRTADVIFVTVFLPEKYKGVEPYRDIFFGNLPAALLPQGKTPLLFGQISGDSAPLSAAMLKHESFPIRSLVHATDLRDVFGAVLRAGVTALRAVPVSSQLGIDITSLARLDLARGRWQEITVGRLIEAALVRLLQAHPAAQLMHIYENNRWEHACRRAADRCGRTVTGYQHSAVIRSHLKMQALPGMAKPYPDRIVASGPEARRILVEVMGHDPGRIIDGCALRPSPPPPAGCYRRRGELRHILVLLQGLAILPHFYDALQEAFGGSGTEIEVTLRPHPGFTVAQMIRDTRLVLQAPFRASSEPDLVRELLEHDVVVYGGSTAAMEAVAAGVPAVHLDVGDSVDVDPLFAEPALTARVGDPAQLLDACRRLAALPDAEYQQQAARARAYVGDYFAPPTAGMLATIVNLATTSPSHTTSQAGAPNAAD